MFRFNSREASRAYCEEFLRRFEIEYRKRRPPEIAKYCMRKEELEWLNELTKENIYREIQYQMFLESRLKPNQIVRVNPNQIAEVDSNQAIKVEQYYAEAQEEIKESSLGYELLKWILHGIKRLLLTPF